MAVAGLLLALAGMTAFGQQSVAQPPPPTCPVLDDFELFIVGFGQQSVPLPPSSPPTFALLGDFELSISGRHVCLCEDGMKVDALADHVILGEVEGCLVLKGRVRVKSRQVENRTGQLATHDIRVSADQVVIHLEDGKIEITPTSGCQTGYRAPQQPTDP
jgi:hypothetical protein